MTEFKDRFSKRKAEMEQRKACFDKEHQESMEKMKRESEEMDSILSNFFSPIKKM